MTKLDLTYVKTNQSNYINTFKISNFKIFILSRLKSKEKKNTQIQHIYK